MSAVVAIVLYRCEVAGVPADTVDIQVRYFDAGCDVESFLREEATLTYRNDQGETVAWPFVRLLAVETFAPGENGQELVGFITGCHEFEKWVGVDARSGL